MNDLVKRILEEGKKIKQNKRLNLYVVRFRDNLYCIHDGVIKSVSIFNSAAIRTYERIKASL